MIYLFTDRRTLAEIGGFKNYRAQVWESLRRWWLAPTKESE